MIMDFVPRRERAFMTLDKFLTEERKLLAAFEAYWRDGMRGIPEDFPGELRELDWLEQYAVFRNNPEQHN